MKSLSRADEILLVAVLCLGDEAFSTTIREEVSRRADKAVSVGSLWVSLDHLAEAGLLRKSRRQPQGARGGRPRIYYRLTPPGIRALKRSREEYARLWDEVPDPDGYPTRKTAGSRRDPARSPRV